MYIHLKSYSFVFFLFASYGSSIHLTIFQVNKCVTIEITNEFQRICSMITSSDWS